MATTKKPVEEAAVEDFSAADFMEQPVTIKLPRTKDLQDDVFVRVNQRTWQIQRGVRVDVPRCVAEVLENAEEAERVSMLYQEEHVKSF